MIHIFCSLHVIFLFGSLVFWSFHIPCPDTFSEFSCPSPSLGIVLLWVCCKSSVKISLLVLLYLELSWSSTILLASYDIYPEVVCFFANMETTCFISSACCIFHWLSLMILCSSKLYIISIFCQTKVCNCWNWVSFLFEECVKLEMYWISETGSVFCL
jgi:hypothetical protein